MELTSQIGDQSIKVGDKVLIKDSPVIKEVYQGMEATVILVKSHRTPFEIKYDKPDITVELPEPVADGNNIMRYLRLNRKDVRRVK